MKKQKLKKADFRPEIETLRDLLISIKDSKKIEYDFLPIKREEEKFKLILKQIRRLINKNPDRLEGLLIIETDFNEIVKGLKLMGVRKDENKKLCVVLLKGLKTQYSDSPKGRRTFKYFTEQGIASLDHLLEIIKTVGYIWYPSWLAFSKSIKISPRTIYKWKEKFLEQWNPSNNGINIDKKFFEQQVIRARPYSGKSK